MFEIKFSKLGFEGGGGDIWFLLSYLTQICIYLETVHSNVALLL